jgi:penicillin-binding protein A
MFRIDGRGTPFVFAWCVGLAAFSAWAASLEVPAAAEAPAGPTAPVTVPTSPAIADDREERVLERAPLPVPSRISSPPIASAKPLAVADDMLARARLDGRGRLVIGSGMSARTLTVIPELQQKLTGILDSYDTPYAAVVAMDPRTGRVLAMAEHSEADRTMRGLPVKAIFPAASIFKIVTATALLDAGVEPEDTECSHGGKRRLSARHLLDSARDRSCYTLASALGHSANGVFAKLTAKYLTRDQLLSWANRFGFNRRIDFVIPTDVSPAAVPEDLFELASTGAGFGDVFLSPIHGAALASVAASGGVWRNPILFDDASQPLDAPRVMTEEQARKLTEMLEETVTTGTARRVFRQRGFRVPGAVGKTGTLADKHPFRDYSWFVGFAPKENPEVVVSAVIVNDQRWRIRAPWLGREALRLSLAIRAKPGRVGSSHGASR